MRFVISEYGEPLWHQASALVAKIYADLFGASVHGHTDAFVVAQDERTGTVQACVGVSVGVGRPFFVEYHLPVSAEEAVTIHTGFAVPRRKIVEFGPVVSSADGAGRAVMKTLPYFAEQHGKFCGVFTATNDLVVVLRYLRFPFEPLARARREQLPPDEQDGWGTYYHHGPVNGLIRLDKIMAALDIDDQRLRANGRLFEYEKASGHAWLDHTPWRTHR